MWQVCIYKSYWVPKFVGYVHISRWDNQEYLLIHVPFLTNLPNLYLTINSMMIVLSKLKEI